MDASAHTCMYESAPVALVYVYILYETMHIMQNICLHEYLVDARAHEYVYVDISIEFVRFFFFWVKFFALVDARAHTCMYGSAPFALMRVYILYRTTLIMRKICLHEYVIDARAHEHVYVDMSIQFVYVHRVDICASMNACMYVSMCASMCVYVHVGDKYSYCGVYVGRYVCVYVCM